MEILSSFDPFLLWGRVSLNSLVYPGSFLGLWNRKDVDHVASPAIHGRGPRLPLLQWLGSVPLLWKGCVPAPHTHTPTPSPPRKDLHTLGCCLHSSGHEGAVELPVHGTSWRGRVVRLVPEVLDFLWYLWICIECILSNLAVQTRQLVVLVGCFCFFSSSPSLLPLAKRFLGKLNL